MKKTLVPSAAKIVRFQATKGDLRRGLPICLMLLSLTLSAAAAAQAPGSAAVGDTVTWTVAPQTADDVKPGSRLALVLHGTVLDGWHVYALKQLPDGPTPLRVALDPNDVAVADGSPTGSPPTKVHDPSFNLDTQFYSHAFTVTAPVRVGKHLAAGRQAIPVNVRFQTCTDRICLPPKTVHLSAPITVRADG